MAGEEASHVGGLLVDDLGVWLVGDEPVTSSAGKTRMTEKTVAADSRRSTLIGVLILVWPIANCQLLLCHFLFPHSFFYHSCG
jgi:hypothetical protein